MGEARFAKKKKKRFEFNCKLNVNLFCVSIAKKGGGAPNENIRRNDLVTKGLFPEPDHV